MTVPNAARSERTALRRYARVLDDLVRIPGTNVRIGVDALIGLVPGIGDVAGTALASLIVVAAIRERAPAAVLVRMLLNVLIDTVVGSVPIAGDLFDVGWRANVRNVALLEQHLDAPQSTRAASRLIVGLVVLVLAALLVAACVGAWLVVRALVHHIG